MTELKELTERLDKLAAKVAKLEEERDSYHQLYLETLDRCRKLERGILSRQKSERLAPEEQLPLAMMSMLVANDELVPEVVDEVQQVESHTRRKAKRKLLPKSCPASTSSWCPTRSSTRASIASSRSAKR